MWILMSMIGIQIDVDVDIKLNVDFDVDGRYIDRCWLCIQGGGCVCMYCTRCWLCMYIQMG